MKEDFDFTEQDLKDATAQEREFVLQEIKPALEGLKRLEAWILYNRPTNINEIMIKHLKDI